MATNAESEDVLEGSQPDVRISDITNDVFKRSVLFATNNALQSSPESAQPPRMTLPMVQGPQVIRKCCYDADPNAHPNDLEYLWMPSMRVDQTKFKTRLEKYAHMEFTRNKFNYRLYTPRGGIAVFLTLGFLLLGLGIALMISSRRSFTLEIPYSELNHDPITFTISRDLKAPVYLYYKLSNFYITHKKVAYNSSPASISHGNCKSYATFEEILNLRCIDGKNTLNGVDEWCDVRSTDPTFKLPAYPCGAISATVITDNFMICPSSLKYTLNDVKTVREKSVNCLPLSMRQDELDFGLFHASKRKSEMGKGFLWFDLTNNMFRSWIKLPYDSTFLKPYGVLNQDMPAGEYTLYLTNNFWPSKSWAAQKAFYIAKPGFLGTSATIFEIIVLVTATVYLLSGFVIAVLYMRNYNCGISPWRGITVSNIKKLDAAYQPTKYLFKEEPRPATAVEPMSLPCLCPCH